jgi:hypothetical protein
MSVEWVYKACEAGVHCLWREYMEPGMRRVWGVNQGLR